MSRPVSRYSPLALDHVEDAPPTLARAHPIKDPDNFDEGIRHALCSGAGRVMPGSRQADAIAHVTRLRQLGRFSGPG